MEFAINFDDMNWAAIGPELIIMMTAFFILLAGLKKEMNTLSFLSGVSLVGIGAALLFTLTLWVGAPTAENGNNPSMFSGALIYDRFSLAFNLIFLLMSLFVIFGSVGSVLRSVQSIWRPRVVVDRPGDICRFMSA